MKARRPNSDPSKAGKIPPDLVKMITDEFIQEHKAFLEDKVTLVEGLLYQDEIYISFGFKEKGALRQVNFEASIDFDAENTKALDRIHLAVDALNSMLSEYVEAKGDIELPLDWKAFDYSGVTVFLRSNTENTEIEKMTEEFLKNHPELADSDPIEPSLH